MANILLIDDDQHIHKIIPLFLEDAGHSVLSALDGPSGIAHAERAHPDLILLDLAMPRMDGTEALGILKSNAKTANIPVIIFTIHDLEDLPENMPQVNCAGYLTKPVTRESLHKSIQDALFKRPQLRN